MDTVYQIAMAVKKPDGSYSSPRELKQAISEAKKGAEEPMKLREVFKVL